MLDRIAQAVRGAALLDFAGALVSPSSRWRARRRRLRYPMSAARSRRASGVNMPCAAYPNGEERCIACKLCARRSPGPGHHH